jgi:phosphoglucosamine mutase
MLQAAITAGVLSGGGDVIDAGVIPTPAVAYLAGIYGADAGIVISASHNPYEYNGIKFFKGDGFKLDDRIEDEIEAYALGLKSFPEHKSGADVGRIIDCDGEPLQKYAQHLLASFNAPEEAVKNLKIVVDSANGAAYLAAKEVFSKLGAAIMYIGDEPDGININDGIGSTHPQVLRAAVLASGADIGLAFDGDADRLIAVDEKGDIVDGDKIMYLCAKKLKEDGNLAENLLTATVMSNIGHRLALEEAGIEMDIADVGDRYVLENMQKNGSIIGGEQSGHIIFLDRGTTGDGMFAALRLIEALLASGGTLSEAAAPLVIYPQVLKNARVKNENKTVWKSDPEISIAIEKIESTLEGKGRVLIRASGTEPLVRVMLEGQDQEAIEKEAEALALLIEKKLG